MATAQVAVITGGGRGLGLAIAKGLAQSGASVAIGGRSRIALEVARDEIRRMGTSVVAVETDVTDEEAAEHLIDVAERELGPIDLLVNNAGVTERGAIWDTDASDWWHVVEVNLRGPYLCSRAALKRMVPRHGGRIVNVGSNVGNHPNAEQSAYAVSKAALLRLTDCIDAQASQHGVRVFAISPGPLDTDMGREVRSWAPDRGPSPVPASLAVDLILEIASGRVDPLAGLLIHAKDDRTNLLARASDIRSHDLYQLRLSVLTDSSVQM